MKYILFLLCIYSVPIDSQVPTQSATERILSRMPAYTARQIQAESSGNDTVVSKKGAVGKMQVKPSTATDLMRQTITANMLKDSTFCLLVGTLYMNRLRRFWTALGYGGKRLEQMTLMSYNGGPAYAINRHFKANAKQLRQMYWHYDVHNTYPKTMAHLPVPKVTKYVRDIL